MNTSPGEFAIGEQPLVDVPPVEQPQPAANIDDLGELPRAYDMPLLVAVARDPRTVFAYWEVDWPATFGDPQPSARKVYLRVLANGDNEESAIEIEPLAGSCYVNVANADTHYRLELGYFDAAGQWRWIVTSGPVITPRDTVEQSAEFQLVTVPLHLSFQRLVDIFRGSKFDGQAISDAIADLQHRFETGEAPQAIAPEHMQLVQALQWSLSPSEANERAAFRSAANQKAIGRVRLERILGFGAANPTSSTSSDFGGGS